MSYRHLSLAVLLVTIAACTTLQPNPVHNTISADAGNAAAGLAYAQQACAQCHAVAAGRTWSRHVASDPMTPTHLPPMKTP